MEKVTPPNPSFSNSERKRRDPKSMLLRLPRSRPPSCELRRGALPLRADELPFGSGGGAGFDHASTRRRGATDGGAHGGGVPAGATDGGALLWPPIPAYMEPAVRRRQVRKQSRLRRINTLLLPSCFNPSARPSAAWWGHLRRAARRADELQPVGAGELRARRRTPSWALGGRCGRTASGPGSRGAEGAAEHRRFASWREDDANKRPSSPPTQNGCSVCVVCWSVLKYCAGPFLRLPHVLHELLETA
jgi:hypothetical protein